VRLEARAVRPAHTVTPASRAQVAGDLRGRGGDAVGGGVAKVAVGGGFDCTAAAVVACPDK